jgi:hypothetical protein
VKMLIQAMIVVMKKIRVLNCGAGVFAQLKLNNYFSLHLCRWFEACH